MEKYIPVEYIENGITEEITFLKGVKDNMINVTDMTKLFPDKNIKHFLEDVGRRKIVEINCKRNQKKDNSLIINDVEISTSLNISQLAIIYPESIKIVRGANKKQGTWFHHSIAYEFARYLSPEFGVWCNDKIDELFKKGYTSLGSSIDSILTHTSFKYQRSNSQKAGGKIYNTSNKNEFYIQNYFSKTFESVMGVTPSQYIRDKMKIVHESDRNKVKNRSGRENGRFFDPELACVISHIDELFTLNDEITVENLPEIIEISLSLEPAFKQMKDLGYLNDYEKNMIEEGKKMLNKRLN
jgi:AraC-like DNA-binding protein